MCKEMYLDVLEILDNGKQYTRKEVANLIADKRQFTKEDMNERIQTGALRYQNRIGWTCTHLIKASLIESKKRGYVSITSKGKDMLKNCPENINNDYFLEHFPDYREFNHPTKKNEENETIMKISDLTPEDQIKESMTILNDSLASELLDAILNNEPAFFEKLVVDLLLKMGYGGFKDAGTVTQISNDGGIDGIIKEDKLGLESILLQAKRYKDTSVGLPEIQSFVGALNGEGTDKGVFITTSKFTSNARQYADNLTNVHLVLIDGELLTNLMIEYGLGVNTIQKFEIKQLDSDYFDE